MSMAIYQNDLYFVSNFTGFFSDLVLLKPDKDGVVVDAVDSDHVCMVSLKMKGRNLPTPVVLNNYFLRSHYLSAFEDKPITFEIRDGKTVMMGEIAELIFKTEKEPEDVKRPALDKFTGSFVLDAKELERIFVPMATFSRVYIEADEGEDFVKFRLWRDNFEEVIRVKALKIKGSIKGTYNADLLSSFLKAGEFYFDSLTFRGKNDGGYPIEVRGEKEEYSASFLLAPMVEE